MGTQLLDSMAGQPSDAERALFWTKWRLIRWYQSAMGYDKYKYGGTNENQSTCRKGCTRFLVLLMIAGLMVFFFRNGLRGKPKDEVVFVPDVPDPPKQEENLLPPQVDKHKGDHQANAPNLPPVIKNKNDDLIKQVPPPTLTNDTIKDPMDKKKKKVQKSDDGAKSGKDHQKKPEKEKSDKKS